MAENFPSFCLHSEYPAKLLGAFFQVETTHLPNRSQLTDDHHGRRPNPKSRSKAVVASCLSLSLRRSPSVTGCPAKILLAIPPISAVVSVVPLISSSEFDTFDGSILIPSIVQSRS